MVMTRTARRASEIEFARTPVAELSASVSVTQKTSARDTSANNRGHVTSPRSGVQHATVLLGRRNRYPVPRMDARCVHSWRGTFGCFLRCGAISVFYFVVEPVRFPPTLFPWLGCFAGACRDAFCQDRSFIVNIRRRRRHRQLGHRGHGRRRRRCCRRRCRWHSPRASSPGRPPPSTPRPPTWPRSPPPQPRRQRPVRRLTPRPLRRRSAFSSRARPRGGSGSLLRPWEMSRPATAAAPCLMLPPPLVPAVVSSCRCHRC